MQKYVTFLSQLQNRQNQHISTALEGSTEYNQISFDQLLEKIQENTSPCFDHVFNRIQLNQINGRLLQRQKENGKKSFVRDHEEMVKDRQDFNKKLEQKLSKSKEKYKKQTISLNADKQQKEQMSALHKQNSELKTNIIALQQEIEKLNKKVSQINQQANKKGAQSIKELKSLKSQIERIEKEKESNSNQVKNLNKKLEKYEETIRELQKKLRVKEKQMKKMEQLNQERSNYYQNLYMGKQTEIENIKSQLSKKSQQIYTLAQASQKKEAKCLELLQNAWGENKSYQSQLRQKVEIIQKMNAALSQGVELMEEHLKQPIEKSGNYSTGKGYSIQYKSKGRQEGEESYFKYFLNLIQQIIERNTLILNRKAGEIKNFQGIYQAQFEDLDRKMSYLLEENKHLKAKNVQISKSQTLVVKKQPIYQPFNMDQLKKYMSSGKSINYPKIRQEVLSQKTVEVLEEIQRTRKAYREPSIRMESMQLSKERDRCKSETNLFKRSRRSLSWKKPAEILKEYV